MKYSIKIILAACCFVMASSAWAQQELSTYFMDGLYQQHLMNPAHVPDKKITIALPSFYFNLSNSAFALDDVAEVDANNTLILNGQNVVSNLDPSNSLQFNTELQWIGVAAKIKGVGISATISTKAAATFIYPEEFPKLVFEGNGQYVGETINIAPEMQVLAYQEFAVGASYTVKEKITIGGRVKYLNGIADASTSEDRNRIEFYTDPDLYDITIATDYQYNITNLDNTFLSSNTATGLGVEQAFTGNHGAALDLGVVIKPTEKLEIAASATNLGFIKWNDGAKEYLSQNTTTYQGIDLDGTVINDTIDFDGIRDTLEVIFDIQTTNSLNGYTTGLPAQYSLQGSYELPKGFTVGALAYVESFRGRTRSSVALSGRKTFGKIAAVGLVYSVRNKTFDNLGVNAMVNLGPIQVFALTDNVLTAFQPYKSRNVNFRLGANIRL